MSRNHPLLSVGSLSEHIFFSNGNKLIGCGDNRFNQVGIFSYAGVVDTPTEINGVSANDIHQIATGVSHTSLLKKDGTIMMCGNNMGGQLGYADQGLGSLTPLMIPYATIAYVSCGSFFTCFITTNGELLVLGTIIGGGSVYRVPTVIDFPEMKRNRVVSIACGAEHVVFSVDSGIAYSLGRNNFGQLGNGNKVDTTAPVRVECTFNVAKVACGAVFTLLLTKSGQVYSVGSNDNMQLGQSDISELSTPAEVKYFQENYIVVSNIKCGAQHSVCESAGRYYVFGSNCDFQLNIGGAFPKVVFPPMEIQSPFPQPIISLECSRNATYVLTSDSAIYGVGSKACGQSSNNVVDRQTKPSVLVQPGSNVKNPIFVGGAGVADRMHSMDNKSLNDGGIQTSWASMGGIHNSLPSGDGSAGISSGKHISSDGKSSAKNTLVKALYDFESYDKDELSLKEGDIITVEKFIEGDWIYGSLNGKSGMFPSNYVEVVDSGIKTAVSKRKKKSGRTKGGKQAIALYDYESEDSSEISLREGQIVTIKEKDESGWWLVNFSGKKGFAPSNYLEEVSK